MTTTKCNCSPFLSPDRHSVIHAAHCATERVNQAKIAADLAGLPALRDCPGCGIETLIWPLETYCCDCQPLAVVIDAADTVAKLRRELRAELEAVAP